jgi:hypothetical protein
VSDNQEAKRERLNELQAVIAEGESALLKSGECLQEIRDKQLFKLDGHKTFNQYVKDHWGFTSRHANYMIASRDVCHEILKLVNNLSISGQLITNPRQVRELIGLDYGCLKYVLQEVNDRLQQQGIKKATAAFIRQIRKECEDEQRCKRLFNMIPLAFHAYFVSSDKSVKNNSFAIAYTYEELKRFAHFSTNDQNTVMGVINSNPQISNLGRILTIAESKGLIPQEKVAKLQKTEQIQSPILELAQASMVLRQIAKRIDLIERTVKSTDSDCHKRKKAVFSQIITDALTLCDQVKTLQKGLYNE